MRIRGSETIGVERGRLYNAIAVHVCNLPKTRWRAEQRLVQCILPSCACVDYGLWEFDSSAIIAKRF